MTADPQVLHTQLLAKIDPAAQQWPRAAVRGVLELHKPASQELWSSVGKRLGWQCEECASRCHSRSGLGCEEPLDAEYPCETVKIIASALGVETP